MIVLGTTEGVSVSEAFLHNILYVEEHAHIEGHLVYDCDAEYINNGWVRNVARNVSRFLEFILL
jgi:hypothetical protein